VQKVSGEGIYSNTNSICKPVSIPYLAIGYLYFDRLSAYQNSFRPNAEKIRGDVPNYTNIQPVVQISEVIC
jgi:uncharacterized protein (TIGR02118 family)